MPGAEPPSIVLTIGHSTRTLEEFISLLQAHAVSRVVDVRTAPRSRHNPQFNKASLPGSLKKAGLGYVHMPGLGGLRHAKRDSVNIGWRNSSFRGYADYMQTTEFEESLEELIKAANQERIALMCAEAVPWRCHRSLIADALLVHGVHTEHIISPTQLRFILLLPSPKSAALRSYIRLRISRILNNRLTCKSPNNIDSLFPFRHPTACATEYLGRNRHHLSEKCGEKSS